MNKRRADRSIAPDSVGDDLTGWMAELPGVDPGTESLRQRITKVARLLERDLVHIANRQGLTLGDWEALSFLQRSGPPYEASPKELAEALGVTSGTMSVRIDRVVQAGLVEPSVGRTDRRSRPVRLTKEGRARWRTATAERTAAEQSLLGETLTTQQIEQLNRLLARLLGRLEEELGRAPDHGTTRADEA